MGLSKNTASSGIFIGLEKSKSIGAELQNLLKLFGALVDGSLSKPLAIPLGVAAEKVIY